MGIVYRHISPSGKSYIGETKFDSWEKRATGSPLIAYENCHKFYAAIVKYGWENFEHEILERNLDSKEERLRAENKWIAHYDSQRSGYNLRGDTEGTTSPAEKPMDPVEIISIYEDGFSTREIGRILGHHFLRVYSLLKSSNVTLRGHGAEKKFHKPIERIYVCIVCQCEFTPRRTSQSTCSKECAGFKNTAVQYGVSVKELISRRGLLGYRPDNSPQGGKGRVNGAKYAMHNRWHINRGITNSECSFCEE